MENMQEYLPILLPLIAIQFILTLLSVVPIVKHPTYRFGNRVIWIIIVCVIQFIGPMMYFVLGKGEE